MYAHSSRGMFGKMTIKEERNVFNWCPNVFACKSECLSGLLSKLHLKLLMRQAEHKGQHKYIIQYIYVPIYRWWLCHSFLHLMVNIITCSL